MLRKSHSRLWFCFVAGLVLLYGGPISARGSERSSMHDWKYLIGYGRTVNHLSLKDTGSKGGDNKSHAGNCFRFGMRDERVASLRLEAIICSSELETPGNDIVESLDLWLIETLMLYKFRDNSRFTLYPDLILTFGFTYGSVGYDDGPKMIELTQLYGEDLIRDNLVLGYKLGVGFEWMVKTRLSFTVEGYYSYNGATIDWWTKQDDTQKHLGLDVSGTTLRIGSAVHW